MKKIIILCVLAVVISACQPGGATVTPSSLPALTDKAETMLTLTLNLNQTQYHLGEPITATVGLKNAGSETVVVNERMTVNFSFEPDAFRELVFVITCPSGKTSEFQYLVNVRLPHAQDFLDLAAGETVEKNRLLTGNYALSETGAYTVQAIYQNQRDPGDGRTAWKGELKSNEVKFTVEP